MCYNRYIFECENSYSVRLARLTIKLVYPKFNSYVFLIYLWVRYVIQLERNKIFKRVNMSGFTVKTIPEELHQQIVQKYFDQETSGDDSFYGSHIIIVPRIHFDLLYSENLYYRDGKSLWMSMQLNRSQNRKEQLEIKNDVKNIKRFLKFESKSLSSTSDLNNIYKGSLFTNDSTSDNLYIERIVQIVPCDLFCQDDVYVTEVELFNIKNNISSKSDSRQGFNIKFIPIKSEKAAPRIAQSVSVQMVNTSFNIGTDLIDTLLSNYFKLPQFLHDNDYFTIPLKEKYTGLLSVKYSNIINSIQGLQFKCTRLSDSSADIPNVNESNMINHTSLINSGCYVVRGESEVLLDQNFNSYIPPIRYFQLNAKDISLNRIDIQKHIIEICPYGLDKHLADMKMSIEPFLLDKQVSPLHTELKCVLHPIFLLRGDLGAGCHLLLTRLAQNFGLHFFTTSCRSLIATTAKQTEAKIEAMLQKGKSCAPVLIHLQDFYALGVDAENNEDTRIVESFIQKLEDLYDNFTKFPIIIVASCDSSVELKPNLLRIFLEKFTITSPSRADRLEMLKWLILSKEMYFCNEDFKPLLSINEPLATFNAEKDVTLHIKTQILSADAESIYKNNFKENGLSSAKIEINKSSEIKDIRKKKNKDSTGKKTKNKNLKHGSNIDNSENINNDERKSVELAIQMVSLEKRLIDNPKEKEKIEIEEIISENILAKKNISDPECENKIQNSFSRRLKMNKKILTILEKLSSKTETFLYGDLDMLTNFALKNAYNESDTKSLSIPFKIGTVREMDFENALESLRLMQSKKLGSLKIPNVKWEDIGGLESLKKEISRTIELPLRFPHLLANSGLKRSGLLLWGPPGCGKTLVARAVASQLKTAFLSVKGPELLDMYVGQSERNMRDMFATARACAPCVIFLDEAEAAAGSRGASGDAGGAADRLVSQLLAELDGVAAIQTDSQAGPVIVIAATNRPDLVEPALLRPGRLDRLLYVGPYEGDTNKVRVLTAACRGFNLADNVKLNQISEKLPYKCTGADLSAVVNTARKYSLSRAVHKAESGEIEPSKLSEEHVIISEQDFEKAVVNFVPSISESEMNYYESLKSKLS